MNKKQIANRLATGAAVLALVGAGVAFTVVSHQHPAQAEPKVTAFVIPADMPVTRADVPENPETYAEVQMAIQQEQADAAAAAAAQAAADAAAAAAAQAAAAQQALAARNASHGVSAAPGAPAESGAHNLPAGSPVPLLDAASGFYDISACASGKASGTPPVCD